MSYLLEPEVLADLDRSGCPVCRASHRAGRAWIQRFIRDEMTDATTREAVERAGGFCPAHLMAGVEAAAGEADTLGLALFAEFVLGVAGRRLAGAARHGRAGRGRTHRRPRSWTASVLGDRRCPACEAEELRAAAYVDILAARAGPASVGQDPASVGEGWAGEGWAGGDWAGEDWAGGDWAGGDWAGGDWRLCLPHTLFALDRLAGTPGGVARGGARGEDLCRDLLRSARRRLDRFEQEAARQISRHSYDRSDPLSPPDGGIAVETVRWLAGR